nr:hypothetical protein [uncultured Shinella sp.]
MSKISIIGQIAEIDREIGIRQNVYQKQISAGKMRQAEADMLMQRIQAVRATLVFCQENEADIRAYIAAKRAGPA